MQLIHWNLLLYCLANLLDSQILKVKKKYRKEALLILQSKACE